MTDIPPNPPEAQSIDIPGPIETPSARDLYVPGSVETPAKFDIGTPAFTQFIVAVVLVGLFAVETLSAIAILAFTSNFERAREILFLIISPTVALVGSVTGFYFGERSRGERPHR